MSFTRQPNRTLNEPNRRRSTSDPAIQIGECGLRRHQVPDWALSRSDYDVASCSSDDDHERIEVDDREGYRRARRKKLKVRRRWERTIGPDAYEVPRFCEVLTEHVRSVKDGPLDADGIEEDQGFLAKLSAPYEPPSTSRDPEIDWKKYSPSPLSTPNQCVGCPPGLCNCAAEQDVDNDHESDDDEPIPHLDRNYGMDHDLYTPSGRWEMAKHRPIDGWETLMRIKGEMSPRGNGLVRRFAYAGFCSYSPFVCHAEEGCHCRKPHHLHQPTVRPSFARLPLQADQLSQMEHEQHSSLEWILLGGGAYPLNLLRCKN